MSRGLFFIIIFIITTIDIIIAVINIIYVLKNSLGTLETFLLILTTP